MLLGRSRSVIIVLPASGHFSMKYLLASTMADMVLSFGRDWAERRLKERIEILNTTNKFIHLFTIDQNGYLKPGSFILAPPWGGWWVPSQAKTPSGSLLPFCSQSWQAACHDQYIHYRSTDRLWRTHILSHNLLSAIRTFPFSVRIAFAFPDRLILETSLIYIFETPLKTG